MQSSCSPEPSNPFNSQNVTDHHPPSPLLHLEIQEHLQFSDLSTRLPQIRQSLSVAYRSSAHLETLPSELAVRAATTNSPSIVSASTVHAADHHRLFLPAQPASQAPLNPGWRRRLNKVCSFTTMTSSVKRSMSTPNVQQVAAAQMMATSADSGSNGNGMQSYQGDKRRNKLGYHRTSVACGTFNSLWHFYFFVFSIPLFHLLLQRWLAVTVDVDLGRCR